MPSVVLDSDADAGSPEGGWEFVAERDGAAGLLGGLTDLDPDATYTKSELADRTGVPLKTIYLNDLAAELADLGALAAVEEDDTGSETTYRLVADSDLLAAAEAFDDAYRRERADSE